MKVVASSRRATGRERRGGALVLSVVAVLVVSILAASFLELATSITRRMGSASDTMQALYLAEAGLTEAYTGLAVAKTGNVGSEAQPVAYGGGLFWVEATRHPSGMVELESTAMFGTGRMKLGLVCEPVDFNVSSLGFFTEENLRVNPGALIDSFDSSQGSYQDQIGTPLNNLAIVGSNDDISIAAGDKVFGSVTYGPNGKLTLGQDAVVTGSKTARQQLEQLPPIEVPQFPSSGSLVHGGRVPLIVPPGEVAYKSLEVGSGSTLILKGPLTIVADDVSVRKDAELVFDTTDGEIILHATGSFDLATDSIVTTSTQKPSDSIVMISCDKDVSFGSTSKFFGFIYAPDARVHCASSFEIFGGLVCEELQLAAGGQLHYDLALVARLVSLLPRMYSWRVIDIPVEYAADHLDPFRVMGVDPTNLPTPALGHEDQFLEISYLDQSGTRRTYSGMESDFDWSIARELLSGVRDGVAFLLHSPAQAPVGTSDPFADLVNSSLSSKELRDALLAAAPVSDAALIAACGRNPPMSHSDLMNVLQAHGNLSDQVLEAALQSPALDDSDLKNILEDNAPLSDAALSAAVQSPYMDVSDLVDILIDSSPLAPSVLLALISRVPALSAKNLQDVLNAQ